LLGWHRQVDWDGWAAERLTSHIQLIRWGQRVEDRRLALDRNGCGARGRLGILAAASGEWQLLDGIPSKASVSIMNANDSGNRKRYLAVEKTCGFQGLLRRASQYGVK
jgi:hypothetical protein